MLKSCEGNSECCKSGYPVMLKGDTSGVIVLFNRDSCGVVVKAGNQSSICRSIGYYYESWEMDQFNTRVKSITITDE